MRSVISSVTDYNVNMLHFITICRLTMLFSYFYDLQYALYVKSVKKLFEREIINDSYLLGVYGLFRHLGVKKSTRCPLPIPFRSVKAFRGDEIHKMPPQPFLSRSV